MQTSIMSSEIVGILLLSIISASLISTCTSTPLELPASAPSKSESSTELMSCSTEQMLETPCRCCKMDCWYTIAKTATHELGHVPGQAGEDEAMATLRLIRACMIEECSSICPRPRVPFIRPVLVE